MKITWQMGSNHPENANNLAIIRQWWQKLSGKEIIWCQRIIPQNQEVSELQWELQRFDEIFQILSPELRGITVYWHKPDTQTERSTTPHKLELDQLHQQLYIYPQSQKEVVIRVGIPELKYQKITLTNPEVIIDENHHIIYRDPAQLLEVEITLSQEKLTQLKQKLS